MRDPDEDYGSQPTAPHARLLIADDSADDAALEVRVLRRAGWQAECERVETRGDFERAIARGGFDAVLTDHSIPGLSALDALQIVSRAGSGVPVLVVCGSAGGETARRAVSLGARAWIPKTELARLPRELARSLSATAERGPSCNAAEALASVATTVANSLPSGITLSADAEPDLPAANCEAAELEGVLLHLCSRALAEIPTGGSLRIAASACELGAAFCGVNPWARPGAYVRFSIIRRRETEYGPETDPLPDAVVSAFTRRTGSFIEVESEFKRREAAALFVEARGPAAGAAAPSSGG